MKILHYLRRIRLEDGGVVRAVLNLSAGLAARGHEVTLATIDDQDVERAYEGVDVRPRVVRLEGSGGRFGLLGSGQLGAMRGLLREADVAHLHSMWTTSNVQVAGAARGTGTPYVYSVHGMLDDWSMAQRTLKKKIYLALAGRRALEGAAFVHCTAQAELDQARKWFPRGRGRVVPLICEIEPYRELPGPEAARAAFADMDWSKPTLLYLSRLHYKKGPDKLIRAVGRLRRDGRDVELLFAGTGDPPEYEDELRRLSDAEGAGAHFLGFVAGRDKISLLEAVDLVVIPTSQENFGFVFFEALAAGAALVTTKGTDTWPELVESGGTVLAEAEPESIARAVGGLLDDPDRIRAMGEAGRRWAMANLEPDRVVEKFVGMYGDASGGRG